MILDMLFASRVPALIVVESIGTVKREAGALICEVVKKAA